MAKSEARQSAYAGEPSETVDPAKTYSILGAHWYAQGLYTKDILTGTEIQAAKVYRVKKGDFVYNRLFGWKGSFALATGKDDGCYASHEFPCFEILSDRLDGRYLWFYFSRHSVWDEALALSSGGTPTSRNRLKEDQFLSLEIPLPPLAEQRRIVARIEELSAKIEEARGLNRGAVQQADALAKSALRGIFSGNGPTVTLVTICAAIIDNLHSNPDYADDGVPCVRSPDVGWGTLNLSSARRTTEGEYRRRTVRGEPQTGDIVLVREGGGTGKAALVGDGQRFSLGQRVMMIHPDQDKVVPKFVLYQILSPAIYDDQIIPLSKGSASPHLNIGALKKFRFRLPPLEEQRRIVAYLDELQAKVNGLKTLQEETAKELDALMPSILSKAFSGAL